MESERRLHFILFEGVPVVVHHSEKITSLTATPLVVSGLLV